MGFPVRLTLDLCMVFSANPEDYTNRGRIVTPLKDRIGSVVRTHYPLTRALGMEINDRNAWLDRDATGAPAAIPVYIKEVVEEIERIEKVPGLRKRAEELAGALLDAPADPHLRAAATASAAEFILEGLHVHNKLNKNVKAGTTSYKR